jgi:hypothetical protein
MINEAMMITDSLGDQVWVKPGFLADPPENEVSDTKTELVLALKEPALLVEVNNPEEKEHYYYRSVNWHLTLLLTSRFQYNRWEVTGGTWNPSSNLLSDILKKGKRLV